MTHVRQSSMLNKAKGGQLKLDDKKKTPQPRKLPEPLTDQQRKRLIQSLCFLQRKRKNINLKPDLKNQSSDLLNAISGGQLFDTIEIQINNKQEKREFSVVILLKLGSQLLPKAMMCDIKHNGIPVFITDSTLAEHTALSGELEGEGLCFHFTDPAGDTPKHKAALSRLDQLLVLAVKTQDQIASLN